MKEKSQLENYSSFEDFWPFYVCEHGKTATRWFHFVGTLSIVPICVAAIVSHPAFLIGYPICAYGLAWASHFFIEKNRPATFTYPLMSLVGDYKMFWYMLCGKMNNELARCQQLLVP